jgi:hypothetical protein
LLSLREEKGIEAPKTKRSISEKIEKDATSEHLVDGVKLST